MFRILEITSISCIFFNCLINACPIYLTIALNGKTYQDSFLEINWGPDCYQKPHWIGIFNEDPSISNSQPLYSLNEIQNNSGKFLTNVKVGKLRFPKGWNRNDLKIGTSNLTVSMYSKGRCLSYYIASFFENELLTVECLKIQPCWMGQLQNIYDMQLKDLFIPGSHSSAAYLVSSEKDKSFVLRDYLITQHFDVWSQLVFGIRYLDLSIGFKLDDNYNVDYAKHYWIVNENMFVNQLVTVLNDIKHFVQISKEVVIVDFSSFPIGFYKHPERHRTLWQLLYEKLDNVVYKLDCKLQNNQQCYNLSLNDIKKMNKYIIVLYPIEELPYPERGNSMLCPSWKRFTTSFMNISETLNYMSSLFSGKSTSPIQGEGWIFHAVKSLEQSLNTNKMQKVKERAAFLSPKVTGWLKGPWSSSANVVALDFVSNTNLIDVAIYSNLQKAFKLSNKDYVNIQIAPL